MTGNIFKNIIFNHGYTFQICESYKLFIYAGFIGFLTPNQGGTSAIYFTLFV